MTFASHAKGLWHHQKWNWEKNKKKRKKRGGKKLSEGCCFLNDVKRLVQCCYSFVRVLEYPDSYIILPRIRLISLVFCPFDVMLCLSCYRSCGGIGLAVTRFHSWCTEIDALGRCPDFGTFWWAAQADYCRTLRDMVLIEMDPKYGQMGPEQVQMGLK